MFGRRVKVVTTSEAAAGTRRAGLLWTDPLGRAGVRAAQVLLLLVAVIAVVYAAVQLKLVVIPVLISLILAAAVSPLVRLFAKVMPRALAAVLALLIGLGVFGGVITLIVFNVRSQYDSLEASVLDGIDQVVAFVDNGALPISQDQIDEAITAGQDFLTSGSFASGALAGATTALELVTGTVLALFILFYFLKDGPQIWAFLIRPLRSEIHAKADRAGGRAVKVLGGYIRGTATVALVDSVGIGIALFAFQVPLAIPLIVITFVGAFIPIVGATAGGILAALVTLVTVGPIPALVVTIVVIVVQQLEGNVLQPIVLGNALSLHGLVVLLVLTGGSVVGGIVGTLLSVPLTAVVWAMIKSWNEPIAPSPAKNLTQGARDRNYERKREQVGN